MGKEVGRSIDPGPKHPSSTWLMVAAYEVDFRFLFNQVLSWGEVSCSHMEPMGPVQREHYPYRGEPFWGMGARVTTCYP